MFADVSIEIEKIEDFPTRCVLLSKNTKVDIEKSNNLNIYQQTIPIDGNWITTYKKNERVIFTAGDGAIMIKSAENIVKIGDDYMHLL